MHDLSVVSFHVMKGVPPQPLREGRGCPQSHQLVRQLEEREQPENPALLRKRREQMLAHGLDWAKVEVKPHPRVAGAARAGPYSWATSATG